MIFQIDDELIPDIDTPINSTRSKTPSIVLNGYGKYKHLEMESINLSNDTQFLKDAVLLATSFRKSIVVLVVTLKDSKTPVVPATLSASTSIPNNYEH